MKTAFVETPGPLNEVSGHHQCRSVLQRPKAPHEKGFL